MVHRLLCYELSGLLFGYQLLLPCPTSFQQRSSPSTLHHKSLRGLLSLNNKKINLCFDFTKLAIIPKIRLKAKVLITAKIKETRTFQAQQLPSLYLMDVSILKLPNIVLLLFEFSSTILHLN